MGWANCGEDSKGRQIGYAHEATCDHPDCNEEIDRGLAYACGGMHGNGDIHGGDYGCEGYFCESHRQGIETPEGDSISVCGQCYAVAVKCGYDDETGKWKET